VVAHAPLEQAFQVLLACVGCLVLADAVEKVRDILLTRNNRIMGVDFLNRTCAFDAHFESILLRKPPKNLFRQHRPNPAVIVIRLVGQLSRDKLPFAAMERHGRI